VPNYSLIKNKVTTPCASYFLKRFLSKLPQLEHLRLNFQAYGSKEANDLISWLSKPTSSAVATNIAPGLLEAPQPIHFAKLRQLDIGMITIDPQILFGIIQKYQGSLRGISLRRVCLLLPDSATQGSQVNPWAELFDQLSKLNLNLSNIHFSELAQRTGSLSHLRSITFKGSRYPGSRDWAGTNVQSGFRDFINEMVLSRLNDQSSSTLGDEGGEGGESDESGEGDVIDLMGDNDDDDGN